MPWAIYQPYSRLANKAPSPRLRSHKPRFRCPPVWSIRADRETRPKNRRLLRLWKIAGYIIFIYSCGGFNTPTLASGLLIDLQAGSFQDGRQKTFFDILAVHWDNLCFLVFRNFMVTALASDMKCIQQRLQNSSIFRPAHGTAPLCKADKRAGPLSVFRSNVDTSIQPCGNFPRKVEP